MTQSQQKSMNVESTQKKPRKKPRLGVISKLQMKGYLFILPWFIGFLVFFAYPLVQSVIFSLSEVKITARERVVDYHGLTNYIFIFRQDIYFMERMRAFVVDTLIALPLILVFSLAIAMLLNQKIRFKGIFRSLFFLPVIVVSGPVLSRLMGEGATTIPLIEQYGVYGIINDVFPPFIASTVSTVFQRLILMLWYSGVPILINLAGLQKVDYNLYEAALIDGASAWVVFWKITLPSLKFILLLDAVYTLVLLGTSEINDIIILIRDNMLNPSRGFGIAAAMAWIHAIGMALMLLVVWFLLGRSGKKTQYADTRKRIERNVNVQTARTEKVVRR